ncbi:MAG: PAS domain S-box protein [Chloroflexi bacterium]|nr:PAS domain S-box protein [Chloroflexota bacterium]
MNGQKIKRARTSALKRRSTLRSLTAENAELRARLCEAEETLNAIRSGGVDALVVDTTQGTQIFSLKSADYEYRVLIEEMSDGAATVNAAETVLYCNRRFAQMLGAPLEKIIGSKISQWIPPRDHRVFNKLMADHGTTHHTEMSLRRADRKLFPAYVSVSTLQMDGRGVYCVIATDLSEQKRNQEIVASEKLARAILDQAAEAIIVCDTQSRIIRTNQVANALCDSNPVGQLFSTAFPLKMPNERLLPLVDFVTGEIPQGIEVKLERPQRALRFAVNVGTLSGESEYQRGYVVTLVDMTDRKQMENRLREMAELAHQQASELRTVIASLPIGLVIYDRQGKPIMVNDSAQTLLGSYAQELYTPLEERLASQRARTLDGEPVTAELSPLYRALHHGETVRDFKIVTNQDTEPAYTSINSAPVYDVNDQITGAVSTFTDITGSKRAEKQQQEYIFALSAARLEAENERNRLEAVMQALPVGVAIMDAQGGFVKSNQALEKIWGAPRPIPNSVAEYAPYKAVWSETGKPVQPEEWASARAVQKGETVIGQLLDIQPFNDAPPVFIVNSAAPIRDANGHIIGSAVALQDITMLRRAQEALKKSEEQFYKAFRFSPIGMSINRSSDGVILQANQNFADVLGWSRKQILGHTTIELGLYNDAEERSEIMQRLAEHGHLLNYELSSHTGSGQPLDLLLSLVQIEIGGEACVLMSLVDITERKRMERSLADTMQRLEAHIENSPLAVIEFDPEFRVIGWSAGAERMFGWTAAEVLNKRISELHWVYEDDLAQVVTISEEMLSGRDLRNMHANRNYRKDGTVIDCEWYNSALFDSNGKLISVRSQVLDVTERKRLQAELEAVAKFPAENSNPVMRVNEDGVVLYANPASAPLLRWWNCEVGKLMPEPSLALVRPMLKSAAPQEIEITTKDRIFSLMLTPIANSGYLNIYGRDITAHKQAEQKLAEQAFMFANINDAIIRTDLDSCITYWSKSAERMYGYAEAEVLGKFGPEVLKSSYSAIIPEEIIQRLNETGKALVEVIHTTKDGRCLTVEVRTAVLYDELGHPLGYLSVNSDMTERKQREELGLALNSINDIIINSTLDYDKIISSVLAQAAQALVCDSAAIALRDDDHWIVKHVYGLDANIVGVKMNDDEERHAVLAIETKQIVAVDDAFEDERFNRAHLRKWGIRSVLVVPIIVQNETIGVIFFNYQKTRVTFQPLQLDFANKLMVALASALENARLYQNLQIELAERRRMELVLRQSEERFRLALAHAPISVAAQDCNLRFIWVFNRQELDASRWIGKTDADLYLPEEAEHLTALKRRVMTTAMPLGEQLWVTAGGRRVFLDLFLEPLRAPNQEIIGVGVATVDLTELKMMEMQARTQAHRITALADLSQKLGQAALDIQAMADVVTRDIAEMMDGTCFISLLLPDEAWFYPQSAAVPNGIGNFAEHVFPLASTVLDAGTDATLQAYQPSPCRKLTLDEVRPLVQAEHTSKLDQFRDMHLLVTPLQVQGKCIGILGIMRKIAGPAIIADEPSFLQDVADRTATAFTNAKLFQQIESARAELEQRVQERTESERQQRQLAETLRDASRTFNQTTLDLKHVTAALMDYLALMVPYDSMQVMLLEGDKRLRVFAATGYPVESNPAQKWIAYELDTSPLLCAMVETKTSRLITHVNQEPECVSLVNQPEMNSWLGVPLLASNQIVGLYTIHKVEPEFFTAEHVRLADTLAAYAAIAIQNAQHHSQLEQAHAQLQTLSRQLLEAEENERRAVARELHDEIGQVLTAVRTNLEVIRLTTEPQNTRLEESTHIIDQALEQVRSLSLNLRPSMLDEFGLVAALEWYLDRQAQRSELRIEFTAEPRDLDLSVPLATTCFRVVQAAITNVVRHARAQRIQVKLYQRAVAESSGASKELELQIIDDGVGFDVPMAIQHGLLGESMGILGMQERVRLANGQFTIESQPGCGTQICVHLPIE